MREGSSLNRFRQGMSRDFQRGLYHLRSVGPKVLQWFSNAGRRGLPYQSAIKEAFKRHLLFYTLGCIALLGGGLYWAWQMSKQAQGVITPLKTQLYVYGRFIARSIFSPTVDPVDRIPIVGVHATILSIFISALFAYALYAYGELRKAEEAIFQEPEKTLRHNLAPRP
jgi:hypothetical protein